MRMYYFAYGANLNKRGMSRRCPAAQPVGTAMLKDYKLCFKRFADIVPMPGAQVLGAVWKVTPSCLRALDSYEGADYQQIAVSVTQASQGITAMAYVMVDHTSLAPPSMDYYRDLTVGYRDWDLDEAALRRARYDTLKVGVLTPPPAEQSAQPAPMVKRRSVLWDPADHTSGSLDALTQGRGRFDIKRRTPE